MKINVISTGSMGNAYTVSDGKSTLLLDCGVPLKDIRTGVYIFDLAGCLITHQHKDHCLSMRDLCRLGVDCYAPADTVKAEDLEWHPYANPVKGEINEAGEASKGYNIGTFSVVPFDVKHDVQNVGYWITSTVTGEQMIYFTDTPFIKYRFPLVSYILAECNYSDDKLNHNVAEGRLNASLGNRIRRSHMGLSQFEAFLEAGGFLNLKQIYVLHLSDGNSDEAEIRHRVMEITGAEVIVG